MIYSILPRHLGIFGWMVATRVNTQWDTNTNNNNNENSCWKHQWTFVLPHNKSKSYYGLLMSRSAHCFHQYFSLFFVCSAQRLLFYFFILQFCSIYLGWPLTFDTSRSFKLFRKKKFNSKCFMIYLIWFSCFSKRFIILLIVWDRTSFRDLPLTPAHTNTNTNSGESCWVGRPVVPSPKTD